MRALCFDMLAGLAASFDRLTPLPGFARSSPSGKPHAAGTQYLIAGGAPHGGAGHALTAEALIPGDNEAGTDPGPVAQLHRYFDDMFPSSLGKPLLQW